MMEIFKDKRGFELSEIALWIVALAVLALAVIGIFLLREKGADIMDKIRQILGVG